MTEEQNKHADQQNVPPSPLVIHKQFLKDMSFENPNAPDILRRMKEKPVRDMNIGVDVSKPDTDLDGLPDDGTYYEVYININASATHQGEAMFLCDVTYGAAVTIHGLDEKKAHPILFVEVPRLIYPYVRQLIAETTGAGGYFPLMLAPVDFSSLYVKRFAKQNQEEAAAQSEE